MCIEHQLRTRCSAGHWGYRNGQDTVPAYCPATKCQLKAHEQANLLTWCVFLSQVPETCASMYFPQVSEVLLTCIIPWCELNTQFIKITLVFPFPWSLTTDGEFTPQADLNAAGSMIKLDFSSQVNKLLFYFLNMKINPLCDWVPTL